MVEQDPKQAFGRVAVAMGGWSSERKVSLDSGAAVLAALQRRGVDAHGVDIDRKNILTLADQGFDRVWLALHGAGGEDGVAQAALELQGLPYTGSGVMACALSMDKARTKSLWAAHGIPTPDYRVVDKDTNLKVLVEHLGLPLFVKPSHEGSSIGMSRVDKARKLAKAVEKATEFDREVLVERFIQGAEYTASIVNDQSLPLIRIETPHSFYDYKAKYAATDTRYHCPCGLDSAKEQALQKLAKRAFDVLGARGWGRVDFMLDEADQPWFLEMNAIPGMTSHSLVPMAAQANGVGFDELVLRILKTTLDTQETL